MKSKVTKGPGISFPAGGKGGKMTGKKVLDQAPGRTGPSGSSTGQFPKGGKGKMAGKGSASPAKAC